MSFEFRPRSASVLASMLAAGLVLTVAGCSHLTPLGPDAAATAPPPSHLRSPIVLTAMRVQPPAPAGGCPARFTMISVPGNPGQCVRPVDTPVTSPPRRSPRSPHSSREPPRVRWCRARPRTRSRSPCPLPT
jgi:hypothetical protein